MSRNAYHGTQLHPIVIQIKGYDLVKYDEIKY